MTAAVSRVYALAYVSGKALRAAMEVARSVQSQTGEPYAGLTFYDAHGRKVSSDSWEGKASIAIETIARS